MTTKYIPATWLGDSRPLHLSNAGKDYLYMGVEDTTPGGLNNGLTRVNLDVFFTELAEFLDKRITVADVEIVPAVVTVKNVVVYGG